MLVQGNLLKLEWAIFRPATNVLQAIAFGYVVTGLVLLHAPPLVAPGDHGIVTGCVLAAAGHGAGAGNWHGSAGRGS